MQQVFILGLIKTITGTITSQVLSQIMAIMALQEFENQLGY